MEKPIVFLSHSTKNKRELNALKKLLDQKAVGFIDFFLSSDGESIPLGTNWVQRLNEALKKTKLMFVFVSKEALQSEWLLFESGYIYGQDIHVVPYCLPGTELKNLPSPLKLLQAHTLHCAKDLNSLVKKCNEVFQTKIPEKFSAQEFSSVFRQIETPEEKSKPAAWEAIIDQFVITTTAPPGGADIFERICSRKKLDCFNDRFSSGPEAKRKEVTSAGVALCEESEWYDEHKGERIIGQDKHRYTFKLTPELFGLTSQLIDLWSKKLKSRPFFKFEGSFHYAVTMDMIPHELTTKLYDTEIRVMDHDWFAFRKLRFSMTSSIRSWGEIEKHPHLTIHTVEKISTIPLVELLLTLLQKKVLNVNNKDLAKKIFAQG